MDNQVITHIIKTTITGTIEGKDIIVDFENKSGELPTSANGFCVIAQEGGICTIVINVGAFYPGSKTITVTGPVTEDRTTLIDAMKSTVEAILING